jgi:hypothetical protein
MSGKGAKSKTVQNQKPVISPPLLALKATIAEHFPGLWPAVEVGKSTFCGVEAEESTPSS